VSAVSTKKSGEILRCAQDDSVKAGNAKAKSGVKTRDIATRRQAKHIAKGKHIARLETTLGLRITLESRLAVKATRFRLRKSCRLSIGCVHGHCCTKRDYELAAAALLVDEAVAAG
jgi:hypothetical protein